MLSRQSHIQKLNFSRNTQNNIDLIKYHSLDLKELSNFQMNKPPFKLLIDTAATKSFISPKIAETYKDQKSNLTSSNIKLLTVL